MDFCEKLTFSAVVLPSVKTRGEMRMVLVYKPARKRESEKKVTSD